MAGDWPVDSPAGGVQAGVFMDDYRLPRGARIRLDEALAFLRIIGGCANLGSENLLTPVTSLSLFMSTITPLGSTSRTFDAWEDEAPEAGLDAQFKPFAPEEAVRWRGVQPVLSPWRLVGVQVLVGLAAGLFGWLFTRSVPVALSVLYGAASVVLPTAVMAWGVTSSALTRRAAGHVISMFMGFVLWEGVKLLLTVAMLWSAPRIVPQLNWLALLVGLVIVLKVYWFGFWIQTRR